MKHFNISIISIFTAVFLIAILSLPASNLFVEAQVTSVTGENYSVVPRMFTFDRDLGEGMSGPDVQFLQCILNVRLITGDFGSLTKEAVINFQNAHQNEILRSLGLATGTGFVGSSTRAYLNEQISQRGGTNNGCQKTNQANNVNNTVNSGTTNSQTGKQNQQATTQQNNDMWLLAYLLASNRSPGSAGLGNLGNNRSLGNTRTGNTGGIDDQPEALPDQYGFNPGSSNPSRFGLNTGVNPTADQLTGGPLSRNNSGGNLSLGSDLSSSECLAAWQLYNTKTGEPCPSRSSSSDNPPNSSDTSSSNSSNPPAASQGVDFGGTTVYNSKYDFNYNSSHPQYVSISPTTQVRNRPCGCSPTDLYINNNESHPSNNYDPAFLLLNNSTVSNPPGFEATTGTCALGHFKPVPPLGERDENSYCLTPYQAEGAPDSFWRCEPDRIYTPLIKGIVTDMFAARGQAYGACQNNPQ